MDANQVKYKIIHNKKNVESDFSAKTGSYYVTLIIKYLKMTGSAKFKAIY